MLYYNAKNRDKLFQTIINEARKLGVDLVRYDLDRSYDYNTNVFQSLEHLIEEIVKDMRDWFSRDNLSVKGLSIAVHNDPWQGEFVRVQTRCKR